MKTVVVSITVALALAGCSNTSDAEATTGASAGATTLTNCGRELSITTPPRKAISLEQNATEILLSLGLGDRMAGASYQTDPVLPELANAYEKVPVLAKLYPNREAVLNAQPDFLYSTFSSAYADDAAGSREKLAELGVPAYLSRFACETSPEKVTFDGIFAEITEIAGIFGAADAGNQLVAEQRKRLGAATTANAEGTSVLFYYSGTSTPNVAGTGGLPAAISTELGLINVYGDAKQAWPAGSWEQIAQRDPDVIVLANLTRGGDGDSAEAKKAFLRTNPITAKLKAVQGGRFITVPGSSLDPSVRSVTALEAISTGLKETS